MTQALEGIRVLDFTQGMAGSLATMIMADFGAEVIRVEPAGGDPMWAHPAYLLWQRGKKSVEIDVTSAAGQAQARRLIEGADCLIESLRPGVMDSYGLGYEAASAVNPALVYVSISAFGQSGPYRNLRASDGLVNAKTGRMRDQVGWQPMRPNYRAVNDTSYHAGMFALQGLLAALRVAWLTGRGQWVRTSLLNGVTAPNNPWRKFAGVDLPPDRYPAEADPAAVLRGELVMDRREADPYTAIPTQLCTECQDGRWIMHAHTQYNLFRSWIETIGFGWIWDDPRYQGAPSRYPTDQDRIDLNLMIVARMKEKPAAEWIEVYRGNPNCSGEIMQTTQEALRHPQFLHNGHVVHIDDPRVGRMAQVGALAQMSQTPARIQTPAPYPGQHTAEVRSSQQRQRRPVTPAGQAPRRPLEGITMIEVATWLASPFSSALLADLGARVIKVEPLSGDPFRALVTNENAIRVIQGKQSIAVDLKSADGREILNKLLASADILMHNMRPGAPKRIGLDYDTVREIKPDIVYVYAGSYGSTGPDAARAAFNPTMGAFSGNSVFQSGAGNIPIGDQSPDPIAGSGVATAIMLGLAARLNTGKGQYIETTMINSNVYCNSDDAFSYDGKPPRRVPDKDQLGLEATYRLYQTSDGWVFLSATTDAEFRLLCQAIQRSELHTDEQFGDGDARYRNRQVLGEILESVFKKRTAHEWEYCLTAADVGCVQADATGHRRFLHENEHAKAVQLMVPTQHWLYGNYAPDGRYFRHRPAVDFSQTPCEQGLPFVVAGEHTRQIMTELGYDAETIDSLRDASVVGWPLRHEPIAASSAPVPVGST
jgi:crotonobetainyl-CoA:carnitine CoA-transferase CaiB-like acyl-CoA transferase